MGWGGGGGLVRHHALQSRSLLTNPLDCPLPARGVGGVLLDEGAHPVGHSDETDHLQQHNLFRHLYTEYLRLLR